MGFIHAGTENGWHRYGVAGGKSGAYVDLYEAPTSRRGAWGTGSIHHLAWRVEDEKHQLEVRQRVQEGGSRPTPVIDRFCSSPSISPSRAAFSSSWLRKDRGSLSMKIQRTSVNRWSCRPGWSRSAPASKLSCRG